MLRSRNATSRRSRGLPPVLGGIDHLDLRDPHHRPRLADPRRGHPARHATELGLLNAARWIPYLLFGLLAGVVVDRYRCKPMLVGADLGRAVLLCAIPALHAVSLLDLPALALLVAAMGLASLFFDAADQAFLPRLVPTGLLTSANARLEQSDAVAQTTGPVLATALIKVLGAPLAILVDAASYLISGVLLASIRVQEPAAPRAARRSLLTGLREGMSWVYRHRMLAPMALSGTSGSCPTAC
ncbi:MFS transporter [Saccharopolyspora sp. NPDC050389]|uniref:MFS transporter n=1 Tax=Saccharopolyspora sp. NPDC050389 TaxID=3155516 RepID=UPI0033D1F867